MNSSVMELLKRVNVINRDNGKKFTCTQRLDVIGEMLFNSSYRRINAQGLYHLYARQPFSKLPRNVVLVSTHVDCERSITRCFTEVISEDKCRGTFDNSLTNAAILSLMLENALPDHVIVAFTGDEEEDSKGAKDVARFLKDAGIQPSVIVLDVTDMGWRERCSFTIENDFWDDDMERSVIRSALSMNKEWRFVPEDVDEIPSGIPYQYVIHQEAEADESWDYDEMDVSCFSLCIPVFGEMHSNEGVLVRTETIDDYRECLRRIACALLPGELHATRRFPMV